MIVKWVIFAFGTTMLVYVFLIFVFVIKFTIASGSFDAMIKHFIQR